MYAVSGSGTRSMSDSWISWNPRIEEPSNPTPSSKIDSVSSATGTEKCCMSPGRSQKRKSTIFAPWSFPIARMSVGVATSRPPCRAARPSDLGPRVGGTGRRGITRTLTLGYACLRRGAISARLWADVVGNLRPHGHRLSEVDAAEALDRLLEPHVERSLGLCEAAVRRGHVLRFDQDDAHVAHRGLLNPDGLAGHPERTSRGLHLGGSWARDLRGEGFGVLHLAGQDRERECDRLHGRLLSAARPVGVGSARRLPRA